MDILSAKRWEAVRQQSSDLYKNLSDLREFGGAVNAPGLQALEKPYLIEVNFRNIQDDALRRQAQSLPTSFKLSSDQLALIDNVVPRLVYEDPSLQRLLMVQLAGLILKAQEGERQTVLQSRWKDRLDLAFVQEPEMEAVRRATNVQKLASKLYASIRSRLARASPNTAFASCTVL